MSLEKFKKQRDENLRREMISKMLASFAVTAVVVVAVVVNAAPAEPAAARFLLLSAVSTEIVYRVNVSDPGLTITEGSLKVVIESPYERYEEPLELGTSSGIHQMVYQNSEYTLFIKAKMGFGEETLAKKSVVASTTLSGAVTNFALDENIDLTTNPQQLRYKISTLYDDPQSVVSNLTLEYGYLSSYYLEYDPEAQPESYASIPITSLSQDSWIENIPNFNYVVFIRFVAYLSDSQVVILDSLQFATPFILSASIYQTNLGSDFVEFSFFAEQTSKIHAAFMVNLYKDETLVDHKNVEIAASSSSMEQDYHEIIIRFDNLTPETTYQAILLADYVDPNTFEQKHVSLQTVEFTTLFTPTDSLSGIITGHAIDPSIDLSQRPQSLRYSISTYYQDPKLEVASMNLEYGVLPTEMLISNPSAVPEYFESVSITSATQTSWIENIPNFNYTVVVRLVATLTSTETTILDELQFATPFVVSAFLYPSNVSIDFAELIFYLEQPLTIDVAFSVELYLADALIENQAIELPTDPSLQAGPHTIVFENLTAETTYSAILKANYINPDTLETRNDVLSTIEFTTMPNVVQTLSGSISNYLIDASIDLQTNPQFLRYDVTTIYADPQSEVSSVTLEYGYVPTAVLLMNPNAVPQSYSSVSVTGSSQDSWIEGIPNVNCTVFLRLIALLKNTETVILDEAQFETPLMIMADMTISDISYDYVIFSCFAEPNATTEITYTIELYDSDVLVETKTVPDIVSQPGMPNQGGNSQSVRFENLANPEHLYTAKLVATYIDSHTSETVVRIIQSMEFTTTAQYSYDVTVTPTEFTYEIGILIHDSQFVLSNITYSIFSGVAGNLMYVTGGPLTTDTPDGTDRYYVVSISKQAYTGYTLELLGSKTVNGVVYLSCLLYTIVL